MTNHKDIAPESNLGKHIIGLLLADPKVEEEVLRRTREALQMRDGDPEPTNQEDPKFQQFWDVHAGALAMVMTEAIASLGITTITEFGPPKTKT